MELKERAMTIREAAQRKRLEHTLEDTRQDNERLRAENRALLDETRRERGELERVFDALERFAANDGRRPSRIRRGTALVVAAGGAYVLGAKAGRERFDQISAWWDRMRERGARVNAGTVGEAIGTMDRERVSGAA